MPMSKEERSAWIAQNADDALINSMLRDHMFKAMWEAAREMGLDLQKAIVTLKIEEKPAGFAGARVLPDAEVALRAENALLKAAVLQSCAKTITLADLETLLQRPAP